MFRQDLGSNNDDISVSKVKTSFFSEVNGQKSGYKETRDEVNRNGQLIAKVTQKVDLIKGEGKPKALSTTEVEIPSKGIHDIILKNNQEGKEIKIPNKKEEVNNVDPFKIENGINKINRFSGIDYSPLDMAEYIFWTGDEKGVALTIEEFLEDGLMSRQEAINFLQSIKFNLDFIQHHYQGLEKMNKQIVSKNMGLKENQENDITKPIQYESLRNSEKLKANLMKEKENGKLSPYHSDQTRLELFNSAPIVSKPKLKFNKDRLNDESNDKNEDDFDNKKKENVYGFKSSKRFFNGIQGASDEDYEDVLERLKVADFLYKEYSLEEVIYELAKVMFSQSLTRRSKEAEEALQKFITFLQNEVKHGDISKRLEGKILDVLVAALVDTLSEHPEIMAAGKTGLENITDPNWPVPVILKHLLNQGMRSPTGNSNVKGGLPSKSPQEKLSNEDLAMKKMK